MSQCGCMLPFGRCLAAFNTKYVLIAAIVFFMIGFAISGGAQGWLQESFRSGPPLDLDRLDRLFRRDMQPCVLHSRIAHYGWTCPAFLAVGGGLLCTVDTNTSDAALIGYQILYGLGIGFTRSVAFLSVRADNPESEVPAAIAIVLFTELFGGMCGPVIGNAILQSGLLRYLTANGVEGKTIASVQASVFAIWELSAQLRTQVIKGYIKALNDIYIGAVAI
ncbi:putative mfs toxin efflux pump [Ilyonectria robusta]